MRVKTGTEPGQASTPNGLSDPHKTVVHDVAVNVVISPTRENSGKETSHQPLQSDPMNKQIHATMIISVWNLEATQYFTLTFTSANSAATCVGATPASRTVSRTTSGSTSASPGSVSSPSPSGRRSHSTCSPDPSTPAITHPAQFPPNGPASRNAPTSAPSSLQKSTQLKDAILNSMCIPAYAVWKDMSFGIPNRALLDLLSQPSSEIGDQREFLSQFRLWTEDFKTELGPDEFPIIDLLRTDKRFDRRRYGMKHPRSGALIQFELNAEAVLDNNTGENLGALVLFKDVTEYTDRIAAQMEQYDRQFENIANLVPQLVWTATVDGRADWFSKRWTDYTGLPMDDTLGDNWQSVFHEEDVYAADKIWRHSLATGVCDLSARALRYLHTLTFIPGTLRS